MSDSQRQDRKRLDGFEIEIFKLVRKGATSKQWKEWLRAPLEHAAATGNMDLFTRLMDAGADGSAGWRGCRGRTLLGSAARGRSEEMVFALLNAGAKPDLNVKFGPYNESALHVAAAQGADAVSAALMLAGADPKLRDAEGGSPLHVAARAGHHVVVRELLLRFACPNAKTRDMKHTPLHLAAQHGHALCVPKLLLGRADKDSLNGEGKTPLYLAAEGNQLCAVEALLAAGAGVDIRDVDDLSAIDSATMRGHEDVVRALLRHGGDSKTCDSNGYTALHGAAEVEGPDRDNGGVVRALLEAGADIEAKTTDEFGFTPLHHAAYRTRASCGTINALLEGGADVNALDVHEQTPLHLACRNSSVAGVGLLLRWGADEKETDDDGETAADVVGGWESDDDATEDSREQRDTDNQRIRHMLAHAPADRSWRRRGWLVLCRSYPTKVQLATNSGSISAKVAKAGCDSSRRGGHKTGDQTVGLGDLVGRVVDLEAEDVFRLVVGFL